ncbi:MAG TPA: hypothetical protein VK864_19345, partial [Longimicrobiales bacterium]|nr:hypothetical protein [Longimicrobiales bacterium]
IPGKLRFRKEENLYLIFTRNKTITPINEELFAFVEYLNEKGNIKVKDLADDISIDVKDRKFNRILQLLLHSKIIAMRTSQQPRTTLLDPKLNVL